MKYFMVTAKCGHVGKNNYYKGNLFIKADSKKKAAKIARDVPRVKHDRKDAILNVIEIDYEAFCKGRESNHHIHYYTCESRQKQSLYFYEIEDNVFAEEDALEDSANKSKKKHSLNNVYNSDPTYDVYKQYGRLAALDFIA